MAIVFVGLGSNVGDRQKNLTDAIEELRKFPKTQIISVSKFYETKPVGGPPQKDFLNAAIELQTTLPPGVLLAGFQKTEQNFGRPQDHGRWEPRVLDLDLLFYDDMILNSPELTIPHPLLHQRRFALEPMNEIAPDWIHPILNKTIRSLLKELP